MARYVAFLRAINVGGHTVTMDRLRDIVIAAGFEQVETVIASGNVIFSTRSRSTAAMEKRMAAALEDVLGYDVATFVRGLDEVAAIANATPFPAAEMSKAGALVVGFMHAPLDAAGRRALGEFASDIDRFTAAGREVYWLCRRKQSDSAFSNAVFERRLKIRATFRGLSTVRRIADKYPHRREEP
jgi:uncharacterized protein (DUF1697 family)